MDGLPLPLATRPAPPKPADRRWDAPGKCRWKSVLLRCPVKQEEHMWAGGLAAEEVLRRRTDPHGEGAKQLREQGELVAG